MSNERPLAPWLLPSFVLALLFCVAGWLALFGVGLPFGPSWLPGGLFVAFGIAWLLSVGAAFAALGRRGVLALAPLAPIAPLGAAALLLFLSR